MRASLVIGLGGTGSWGNMYLKRRLFADSRWRSLAEAGDGERGDQPKPENSVWLNAVDVDVNRPDIASLHLDTNEDILLSTPVGSVVRHLRGLRDGEAGAYPTIEQWLPRSEAGRLEISDAQEFMASGAGQIRQFGRIAFFLDVLTSSQGLSRLDDGLARLVGGNWEGERTVYVVSSVSGGTGAGLLIDVLAYLQAVRRERAGRVPFRTIAFISLPGAHQGVIDHDQFAKVQANGYATLRELDRMLNAYRSMKFEWVPGKEYILDSPALDNVYLFDGSRDRPGASQLEGADPPHPVFAAAAADAIYSHILPSSGNELVSRYTNLIPGLQENPKNRYSTFGSYLVEFDWFGLLKAFSLRAATSMATALLDRQGADVETRAKNFLLGRALTEVAGDKQPPLPVLLTEILPSASSPADLVPNPRWLQPGRGAKDLPSIPTLYESFPNLGRIRSSHTSGEIIEEIERISTDYFGSSEGVWSDSTYQFYPVQKYNFHRILEDWRTALGNVVAGVLNGGGKIGGLTVADSFLGGIIAGIDRYLKLLDGVPMPRDIGNRVEEARSQMQDRKGISQAPRQRIYIDVKQEELEQRVRSESLKRARRLLNLLRDEAVQRRSNVTHCRQSLEDAAAELVKEHGRNEELRAENSRAYPLRRIIPTPGDSVEQRLWRNQVGGPAAAGELEPEIAACLGQITWMFDDGPGGMGLRWSTPGVAEDAAAGQPFGSEELVTLAEPLFAPIRETSVFEVITADGETPEDCARRIHAELITNGACLSRYDPAEQIKTTRAGVQIAPWRIVFADWAADGSSGEVSVLLRNLLQASQFEVIELTRAATSDIPTTDKIMVFSANHLIAKEAFSGVQILTDAYRRRRSAEPSPHVLPEEKAAARLEARSESLRDEGLLTGALGFVPPSAIALCVDEELLTYFAAALAGDRVAWHPVDQIKGTGYWEVNSGADKLKIGDERDLGSVLLKISKSSGRPNALVRKAIESAGAEVANAPNSLDVIAAFAAGNALHPGVSEDLLALLKVAAAMHVDRNS